MLMIIDLLEEEVAGIEAYNEMLKSVKNEMLSRIIMDIVKEEKQHAVALANWISEKAKSLI